MKRFLESIDIGTLRVEGGGISETDAQTLGREIAAQLERAWRDAEAGGFVAEARIELAPFEWPAGATASALGSQLASRIAQAARRGG